MSNILPDSQNTENDKLAKKRELESRLQHPEDNDLAKEREAERKWKWILLKFKPSDLLSDESLIRSLASNWSHWNKTKLFHPSGYRMQDASIVVDVFSEYLESKKKAFIQNDIQCFVAWKIWESKANCGNVVSGELFVPVLKWSALMTYETEVYKAFSRIEKRRDDKVIQEIAELLGAKNITPEQREQVKSILNEDRRPFLDAIRDTVQDSIEGVLGIQNPKLMGGNEANQLEGEKA